LLRLLCNQYLMETNEKASVFVFFGIFLSFFYGSQVLLIAVCFYFFAMCHLFGLAH
jgi:hypothetical protein